MKYALIEDSNGGSEKESSGNSLTFDIIKKEDENNGNVETRQRRRIDLLGQSKLQLSEEERIALRKKRFNNDDDVDSKDTIEEPPKK